MDYSLGLRIACCTLVFALCEGKTLPETWEDDPLLFPYRPNSGAGNRDALEIHEILLENFEAPEGVLKWKTLKINQTEWALGLQTSSFILSEITRGNNSTYMVRNVVVDVDQNITDAWIFQVSPTQAVLSLSLKVPGFSLYQGIWYRVTSSSIIERIYAWPSLEPTTYFTAFQYEETIGVALIKHVNDKKSSLEIYRVSFDEAPLISLLNNIWLDFHPTLIVTTFEVQDLYLSMVVPSLSSVEVYRLTRFCSSHLTGKLTRHASLPAEDVNEAKGFYVAGRNYLTIDGKNSSVYIFNRNGAITLARMSNGLGYVYEWLALPVATYRQDILLLAKMESQVALFTWAGTNEGFVEKDFPSCVQSLDMTHPVSSCQDLLLVEPWSGAGPMSIGDAPFFLLPTSSGHTILVHFMTLLHPVLSPDLESLSINDRSSKLYDRWQTIWEDFRLDSYVNKSELGAFRVDKSISPLTLEKTEELVNETLEILKIANSTFGLSHLGSKKENCYTIFADIAEENLVQEDEWFFSGEIEVQMSMFPSNGLKLHYNDSFIHLNGVVSPEECTDVATEGPASFAQNEVNVHTRYPTQEEYFRKNDQPYESLADYAKKHLNSK